MTESQFAYNGLTLDELRSLAASPQVGTLQAMPQSFRALADRVGEVADLLTHAQADLPNWWKGPAADQAAATLGRAAAEAREFHVSAMGAATAVGHCAQVIAEQQNQMMRVPDVAEPGITDVVQRPTTPFEALEAARQDATYQAAHEQAVQVVNGIAAQYVETRARLATISTPRGKNFAGPQAPLPSDFGTTEPPASTSPFVDPGAADFTRPRPPSRPIQSTHTPFTAKQRKSLRAKPEVGSPKESSNRTPAHEISIPLASLNSQESATQPQSLRETSSIFEPPPVTTMTSNSKPELRAPFKNSTEHENAAATSEGFFAYAPARKPPSTGTSQESARTSYDKKQHSEAQVDDFTHSNNWELAVPPTRSQYLSNPPSTSDGTNSLMAPPFGGVGPIHRAYEERNPRPSYLKERKSAWLPDTLAAPADGVITPDWFERP